MKRSVIVKEIMDGLKDDDIVVATTGFISREVFRQKDRDLNFYMMGSMGNALAIGLGLAMHVKQKVIVINGDGAALMGLGSLLTAQSFNLPHLLHIVLDNGCHESTGGQRTASNLVDFSILYKNTIVHKIEKDSDVPPRISIPHKEVAERFKNAIQALSHQQV